MNGKLVLTDYFPGVAVRRAPVTIRGQHPPGKDSFMAATAKDVFAELKKNVDAQADPALVGFLSGLILMAEQLDGMEYRQRKMEAFLDELRRR